MQGVNLFVMSKLKAEENQRTLSKKIRFEVFKRDAFTCQYCGKKAPDVVLEVDHIEPISKGGKTVMLNLVTSCFDCNRGKRNVKLSDNSVIEKQKKALQELSEKQEQLKMLLKWRSGLLNIESQEIQAIQDAWEKTTTYSLTGIGINNVKKLLRQFSLINILESIDISTKYLKHEKGKITISSAEEAFNKMKGICYVRSLPEDKRKEYHMMGVLRFAIKNKYNQDYGYSDKWVSIYTKQFIDAGHNTDQLKTLIDKSETYREWENNIGKFI